MRRLIGSLLLLASALVFAAPAAAQALPDSAALVTRLGDDTLSVERWVRTPGRIAVDAVVRAPRTSRRQYVAHFAPDGDLLVYNAREVAPTDPGGMPERTEMVFRNGDGWARVTSDAEDTEIEAFEGGEDLLPFIDLLFWPYEVALRRGTDGEREQPLLAGRRVMPFTIRGDGPGDVVFAHPFRGPSTVRVDAEGRILMLDAGETTRKVVVTREPWLDVDAVARRWARQDAAGRGVGELSGRAEETYDVAGATIALDYGTPTKRGRTIFGEVVPWGERWRTGANRATHFTTDRPLVLAPGTPEALEVPAGTYTLFSIPEPDGGLLLVNRQTGQNGQTYDPALDLGRVPLASEPLAGTVERFTIRAVETGADAGELRIEWDDAALVVPFEVR